MTMMTPTAGAAYEPLSTEDWMFLACEGRDTPMHVGAVLLFDPGSAPLGLRRFQRYMEAHLGDVPRYRQRLAYGPVDGRPVWVDDHAFDLTAHVRRIQLAPPGDEAAFETAVGRILSRPLDRQRPLWECWLVYGRGDGRFALITKIHHCMVDGVAGADLLALLLSAEPHVTEPEVPVWVPRPVPSRMHLLADTIRRPVRLVADAWREAARITWNPRRLGEWLPAAGALWETVQTGARRAPSSPLNRPVGPHRRVAHMRSDLARAKTIRERLGGTVNDVILTAVAGGLRRFLLARDPEMDLTDLRALVPVDRRDGAERGRPPVGNHVSGWIMALPVSLREPLARHAEVRRITAHMKRTDFARAGEVMLATNGTLIGAALQLVERLRPFNVTVSNIPGPPMPLHLLDARLDAVYPHVPLFRGQGISIAAFSYAGRLHWGFTGECQIVPDIEKLAEAVAWSLVELETAAGVTGARRSPVALRWPEPALPATSPETVTVAAPAPSVAHLDGAG